MQQITRRTANVTLGRHTLFWGKQVPNVKQKLAITERLTINDGQLNGVEQVRLIAKEFNYKV